MRKTNTKQINQSNVNKTKPKTEFRIFGCFREQFPSIDLDGVKMLFVSFLITHKLEDVTVSNPFLFENKKMNSKGTKII